MNTLPHCFSVPLPSQLKHLSRMVENHQKVLPCQCQLFVVAKKSEVIEVHSDDGNEPHQKQFLLHQLIDHSGPGC
jgi:hypothetical protein